MGQIRIGRGIQTPGLLLIGRRLLGRDDLAGYALAGDAHLGGTHEEPAANADVDRRPPLTARRHDVGDLGLRLRLGQDWPSRGIARTARTASRTLRANGRHCSLIAGSPPHKFATC